MRRAEWFLSLVVIVLALFVGVQLARRPHHTPARRVVQAAVDSSTTSVVQQSRGDAKVSQQPHDSPDVNVSTTASVADAPARDVPAILDRIASTPGTYMQQMIANLDGRLVRWPDRRESGLRIWVQDASLVRDWDMRYTQMARNAFADWNDGLPVRLDFVFDSATSDIQLVWIDRFPPELGRRVGNTRRTNDQYGWLTAAQITIAIHDSLGRTIPPEDLAGIVRHEAGHALGLGHSNDPGTKMYPLEMVNAITPMDRTTLRLLYQLPPGPLR